MAADYLPGREWGRLLYPNLQALPSWEMGDWNREVRDVLSSWCLETFLARKSVIPDPFSCLPHRCPLLDLSSYSPQEMRSAFTPALLASGQSSRHKLMPHMSWVPTHFQVCLLGRTLWIERKLGMRPCLEELWIFQLLIFYNC